MSKSLDDFINIGQKRRPSSLFDGDMKAVEISARLSKNQRRMYKRYDIVPAGFYIWLRESRIIRKDEPIPQGGSTTAQLLDFLRFYSYETDQARSTGEHIFRQIIRERTGLPDSAFGLGDYLLEESRCINKRRAIRKS
jgi:hypothetical protein